MDPFLLIGILSIVATVIVAVVGAVWRTFRDGKGKDEGSEGGEGDEGDEEETLPPPIFWCDDTRGRALSSSLSIQSVPDERSRNDSSVRVRGATPRRSRKKYIDESE